MDHFVDRKHEMEVLDREYQRPASSFVVVYGRRRTGKSTLISQFCIEKPCISFLTTEENDSQNRNAFRNAASLFPGLEDLSHIFVDDWAVLFRMIIERADRADRKLIIVMDEFQYLGKANPAFPSILMKIWDETLKSSNIMLILCGSLIRIMREQVLNYDSPLYGRRTAQICLKQIPFRFYHEWNEQLSAEEQLMKYAVTGGVPKYIELFEDCQDIYEGIRQNILDKDSFLYAEPEFLFQKEVTGIGSYFSILKVIALGSHRITEIASRLETSASNLTKYLETLIQLDVLKRDIPVTEKNPAKSKMGQYLITDNFIRFWFTYVYPYKSLLEMDRTDYVLNRIRQHFTENHVSFVYEDICREKIREMADTLPPFDKAGRWWNKNTEIDLVAYDSSGDSLLLGECKYSANPKGMKVLEDLTIKELELPFQCRKKTSYILFSKSGFTEELVRYAREQKNVYLVEGIPV
ncbi:MAG: ATP-binding protein [Eubacterium sp.]|nr:ATP-binding protein [Eubacterium sp.]